MTQKAVTAGEPIGAAGSEQGAGAALDVRTTVLSQYANSPVLMAILNALTEAFDVSGWIDDFYRLVWNVDTAVGFGLDIWGRIVGVNRVLHIPADVPYFGFAEQPFGQGIWYGAGAITQNYALSDDAYRRLILAKAALNLCDGSIPSINAAMRTLFPDHGNCYVRDDGGMAMTYVFSDALSPVYQAIVSQAGVLPKPVGVSVSGEVN